MSRDTGHLFPGGWKKEKREEGRRRRRRKREGEKYFREEAKAETLAAEWPTTLPTDFSRAPENFHLMLDLPSGCCPGINSSLTAGSFCSAVAMVIPFSLQSILLAIHFEVHFPRPARKASTSLPSCLPSQTHSHIAPSIRWQISQSYVPVFPVRMPRRSVALSPYVRFWPLQYWLWSSQAYPYPEDVEPGPVIPKGKASAGNRFLLPIVATLWRYLRDWDWSRS